MFTKAPQSVQKLAEAAKQSKVVLHFVFVLAATPCALMAASPLGPSSQPEVCTQGYYRTRWTCVRGYCSMQAKPKHSLCGSNLRRCYDLEGLLKAASSAVA